MTRNSVGLAAVVIAAITICVAFVILTNGQLPSVDMGTHGWAALILGVLLSLIVGGGLNAILVIGRRRGFDEGAHDLYRDRFDRE